MKPASLLQAAARALAVPARLGAAVLLLLLLFPLLARAQAVATLTPAQPALLTDSLTVTFDAARGDGGLGQWPGDVYVHAGVITPASTSPTDWQHIQGPWGQAVPRLRMRPLGNRRYALRLRPSTFYGLAPGERVLQFAFVFRNADGSASGRNANGSDVLLPLFAATARAYASHQWAGGVLTVTASDGATLTAQPYAPGVLRMGFYPPGTPAVPRPSAAVVAAPATPAGTVLDAPNRLTLTAPGIGLEIQKNPLRLRYRRGPDTLLTEQPGYFEVGRLRGLRFGLRPAEALYGTGSRAVPLDRRGQRLSLYNQARYGYAANTPDLNISIPLVLGGRGFGLFFDDDRPGYLDLGLADATALEYGTEADRLAYFVLAQTTQPDLLAAYTALTGRQPLPPRWALGYIQSKYGYQTESEARTIVQRLRADGFPLSALVLDLYWFGGMNRMGDLDWDRTRFPNPVGMMRDFDTLGVKTVLITEPYVTQQSRNFATLAAQYLLARTASGGPFVVGNFWAGSAGLLDLTNPATRAWLWPFYRARIREGAAGFWNDLGEPETHPDAMRHAGGPARDVHNTFSNLWASVLQDGYRADFPRQRLFNLSRSGYAGMQRLGAMPWSGDVQRSWSGLQAQIPIMLGMGQSGVAYMHADAGGFTGGPQNNELYARWLQLAAFTPLMRAHGEGVPTEPVNYPDPYRSVVRRYARLRHEMLPYTYTLAWHNSATGSPLARPLNFDQAPSTTAVNAPDDAFLWGDDLLVAPVLAAGQTQRTVPLPPGGPWLDLNTLREYPGGTAATLPAPLATLPLLVRGGALLPSQPYRPSTAQGQLDTLRLRYFPALAAPARPTLVYDDNGHTPNAFALGQYKLLQFEDLPTGAASHTLVATATGPGYPQMPARRALEYTVERLAAAPGLVTYQALPLPLAIDEAAYLAADSAAYFDATAHHLRVHFGWRHQRAVVRIFGTALAAANGAAPPPNAPAVALATPYPNPFATEITFAYDVARPGPRTLRIFSLTGQLVAALPLPAARPGPSQLVWDGRGPTGQPLPPGVYVVEMDGQRRRISKL